MNALEEDDDLENAGKEDDSSFEGVLSVDEEEDIPNNTDRLIDFKSQLNSLKNATEFNLPYTLT